MRKKWTEELRMQEELLDNYDLTPYLKDYDDMYDLMDAFEGDFTDVLSVDFQGHVFNFYDGAAIY